MATAALLGKPQQGTACPIDGPLQRLDLRSARAHRILVVADTRGPTVPCQKENLDCIVVLIAIWRRYPCALLPDLAYEVVDLRGRQKCQESRALVSM